MSGKNYYVSVKLFCEQQVNKSFRAHELFEVSEKSMIYRPFRPTSLDVDPKRKFGIIRDQKLVFLNILKMAERRVDLDLGRAMAPKRKSIGNESVPLKKMKLSEENEIIEQTKFSKKKKKVMASANDNDMVAKLDSLDGKKNGKSEKKKRTDKDHLKNGEVQEISITEENDNDRANSKGDTARSSFWKIPSRSTSPTDLLKISGSENEEEKQTTETHVSESKSPSAIESDTTQAVIVNGLTPGVAPGDQSATNSDCKRCPELLDEIDSLKKQLESAQKASGSVLDEIKQQITRVPELVRVFALEKQFLKDEKYIVDKEKGFKDIVVPDDSVYCGNGHVVKKFDIYEVTEQLSFGRRVSKMCQLLWGDSVHEHFLSGKCGRAPPGMQIVKITDSEIKAVKRILKKMGWEGIDSTSLNERGIREFIKHHTSQCLTKHLEAKNPNPKQAPKRAASTRKKKSKRSTSSEEDSDRESHKKKKLKKPKKAAKKRNSSSASESSSDERSKKSAREKDVSSSATDSSSDEKSKKNKSANRKDVSSSDSESSTDSKKNNDKK